MNRLDINVIKNISLYLNNIDYIALKRTCKYMTKLPTSHLVAYRLARKIIGEKKYISNNDLLPKLKKYIEYYDFETIEDTMYFIQDLTHEFRFKQNPIKFKNLTSPGHHWRPSNYEQSGDINEQFSNSKGIIDLNNKFRPNNVYRLMWISYKYLKRSQNYLILGLIY